MNVWHAYLQDYNIAIYVTCFLNSGLLFGSIPSGKGGREMRDIIIIVGGGGGGEKIEWMKKNVFLLYIYRYVLGHDRMVIYIETELNKK